MQSTSLSALLIGSTGQVGQHILRKLLTSPHYSKVGEYGRRLTDLSSMPNENKAKLEQKTIDFENLGQSGIRDGKWDVVLIVLGTNRPQAGSAEAFEKIDREYVVNVAREARQSQHPQRLLYLSSAGADPRSSFLYTRSKGLTEHALARLGYEDTIIFRPTFLAGASREHTRLVEKVFAVAMRVLSHVSDALQVDVRHLAETMVHVGRIGSTGMSAEARAFHVKAAEEAGISGSYTVIQNQGIVALAHDCN